MVLLGRRATFIFAAFALLWARSASPVPLRVSVETVALNGTPAQLAFDLVDGDADTSSSVLVSLLEVEGGSIGPTSTTGGAAGDPVTGATLTDLDFFNELLQDLMLGSGLVFQLDLGPGGPPDTTIPDAFSLFLLDPTTSISLVDTDLLGDALLVVDLVGDGILSVSGSSAPNVPDVDVSVVVVPEPPLLLPLVLFVGALLGHRLRYGRSVAWAVLFALAPQLATAEETVSVDDRVRVSFSGFVLNRATNTFDTMASIENIAPRLLANPLRLVVTAASDARVTLANASGTTALGQPYVDMSLPPAGLAPGARTRVILRFSNPPRTRFTFQPSVYAVCAVLADCPPPRPVRPFVLPTNWLVTRDTDYIVEAHNPEETAFIRLLFQHWRSEGSGPLTAGAYVAYWHDFILGDVFPVDARGVQTSEAQIGHGKSGGPYLRYEFDDTRRGVRYVQVYASGGGLSSIVLTAWAGSGEFSTVASTLEALIDSAELPATP